ncbi:non-ribosomal peptide synthetase family protein [Sinosporangium siamense]|uniref:Carrier domain-containing protein n=1 Tax=Sinosporangium siamense TaxID=1367973 RepID=A0A919RH84_9ACTN|nr:non-ribosomal peptide synthetase [Sinosporangium siamense]GII93697.1 hypothetical protein Ssi02_39280 [Sinosporangium siamense]
MHRDTIGLTSAQHRLWFLERAGYGGATYLVWQVQPLPGPADIGALSAALRETVARHDALRTSIAESDGRPAAVVHARADVSVEVHDLGPDRGQAAMNAVIEHVVGRPFDLDRAPLLRVALIRRGEGGDVLAVAAHHIVCDGPSLAIAVRDMLTCYEALARGAEPRLPAPGAPFADYVTWLADRDTLAADEAYWTAQIAGAPELVELPTDRPRPPAPSLRGDSHRLRLPPGFADALRELCRRERCTPFMVYLTALKVLLLRHSGESDIVVGSPVTNRGRVDFENTVGMFVNTLALRTDLSGDPPVREALRRVRRTVAHGLGHQLFPFERIVELAAPKRDLGHNPLFQVMLVMNAEDPDAGPGHEPILVETAPARFDLTVVVDPGPAPALLFHYATELYEPATVAAYAEQLVRILTALCGDPGTRLWDLPLLSETERLALTGPVPGDPGPLVHELVAARSRLDPSAPAVLGEAATLTYGELDRRANHLAHRLRAFGLAPETPIAVLLPTGADAVVAILGVLKAGCAYVPLDPAHPGERLALMLKEADPPVLVSAGGDGPSGYAGHVLTLGTEEADLPPDVDVPPGHLAYIVFTSGSTGRPKGVMVTHATLALLTASFRDAHGCFAPGERVFMLPPLTFDASVGDVFPALTGGGALVLHPSPASLTGPGALAFCARLGITAIDAPAALWLHWTAGLEQVGGTPLREVMVGGESVPMTAVAAWARLTGGRIPLHNHYGPTEATVCATVYRTVNGEECGSPAHLPIGLPLPHVKAYVLDAAGRLAPAGTPGELYLGGSCLARGYLNDRALTARRFTPDPFGSEPGARMYRTGDLARRRPGGTLEFLGRTDRQVKIRGHRVELGEVEAALVAHPDVRAAAVVAGSGSLTAYVVGREQVEVRAFLRERLPDPMIPGVFVWLDRLPLTPHGKVDYRRLPAPVQPPQPASTAPPTGPVETELAALWADALRLPPGRVGRHDDFFGLGGHSLLAGPVLARVNRRFGVTLPLRSLFETADLAELAALITAGATSSLEGPDLVAEARLPDDVRPHLAHPDNVGQRPLDPDDVRTRPLHPGDVRQRPVHPRTRLRTPADPPRSVLLTGATGFLGRHLLAALLARGVPEVICLVRAGNQADARARLVTPDPPCTRLTDVRASASAAGSSPVYARVTGSRDRVTALPGDLTAPRLGLTAAEFDALAERVDVICHNGGLVNFAQPYEHLRPANVGGTLSVLRLATAGRPIPVHLISTLGVFLGSAPYGDPITEADRPDDPAGLTDGYNQSKWVADRLVRTARERGLPTTVHRPARIAGDSRTGHGNRDDYFNRLLATVVRLGMTPDLPFAEDLSPVDHVSAAIAYLVTGPAADGDFHYFNGATVTYADIAEATSTDLAPWPVWHAEVMRRLDAGEELPIAPFAPTLPTETPTWTRPHFDCTATDAAVAHGGVTPPPSGRDLLALYLEHLP